MIKLKYYNIREYRSVYLNCGTLNGRRRLLTTGGTSLDFGRAGLLAQRAALVNWETREKFLSGPDVVRNTFLIFDFSPEDEDDKGVLGIGTTYIKYIKYLRILIYLKNWNRHEYNYFDFDFPLIHKTIIYIFIILEFIFQHILDTLDNWIKNFTFFQKYLILQVW